MLEDVINNAEEIINTETQYDINLIYNSVTKIVEVANLILGFLGIFILLFVSVRTVLDVMIIQFPLMFEQHKNITIFMSKDCGEALKCTDESSINRYLKLRFRTYIITALFFVVTFCGMFNSVQTIIIKIVTSIVDVLV